MSKKWMSLALAGCLTLSMMTVASATFEKTYTGEHTPSASRETMAEKRTDMAELAEAMAAAKANMEAKRGEMAETRANMEELRTQLAEKAAAIAAMKAEKESSIA